MGIIVASLGAFAKLRNATISFVMYVHLSVDMERLAPTGPIFIKFDMRVFPKYGEKIQVPLKSDMSKGYFTGKPT
jgi:hypothetical protein